MVETVQKRSARWRWKNIAKQMGSAHGRGNYAQDSSKWSLPTTSLLTSIIWFSFSNEILSTSLQALIFYCAPLIVQFSTCWHGKLAESFSRHLRLISEIHAKTMRAYFFRKIPITFFSSYLLYILIINRLSWRIFWHTYPSPSRKKQYSSSKRTQNLGRLSWFNRLRSFGFCRQFSRSS